MGEETNENVTAPKELTYGEKAVGLAFNPSNSGDVHDIKTMYAAIIDALDEKRREVGPGEKTRLLSIAITEAQAAQMWAVKALTWN